jgi:hypothetical protein
MCPVCRTPILDSNGERDVDRLADRLRLAHLRRVLGDAYVVDALPWAEIQDSERFRWRDQAKTAIAALEPA